MRNLNIPAFLKKYFLKKKNVRREFSPCFSYFPLKRKENENKSWKWTFKVSQTDCDSPGFWIGINDSNKTVLKQLHTIIRLINKSTQRTIISSPISPMWLSTLSVIQYHDFN